MSKAKPRDISELTNAVEWAFAIVNKTLPMLPPVSASHDYDRTYDRSALRAAAFTFLLKELGRYEYRASPETLNAMLPLIP